MRSKQNRFLPIEKFVSQKTYISERFLFFPKVLRDLLSPTNKPVYLSAILTVCS